MPPDREQLLPATVLRGIGDKLYDKRKSAALEVEQLVKLHAAQVALMIASFWAAGCWRWYLQCSKARALQKFCRNKQLLIPSSP